MNCEICRTKVTNKKSLQKHMKSDKCTSIKKLLDEKEHIYNNKLKLMHDMIKNLETQNKLIYSQIDILENTVYKYKNELDNAKLECSKLENTIYKTDNKVIIADAENIKKEINSSNIMHYIDDVCNKFKLNDKVENYKYFNCVYVFHFDNIKKVDENMKCYLKFGESSNIEQRIAQHKQKFNNIKIMWIIKVENSLLSERELKEWSKSHGMLTRLDTQTEILEINSEEQLILLKEKLNKMECQNMCLNYDMVKLHHQLELKDEKINGLEKQVQLFERFIK